MVVRVFAQNGTIGFTNGRLVGRVKLTVHHANGNKILRQVVMERSKSFRLNSRIARSRLFGYTVNGVN